MSYQIVQITEEYIIGYYKAFDTVAKECEFLIENEAPHISKVRKTVLNNIENDYPHYIVVVNNEVVGWCSIIPKERPSEKHVGVLTMAFVPEFRGRGLGAKILRKGLEKAKEIGIKRIELSVMENNITAVGLYRKLKFEVEGIKKKACCLKGEYNDLYMMALLDF